MKLDNIFNKEGNFIIPFDPYRYGENETIYAELFDEEGHAIRQDEAAKFINRHNCSPFSDVVMYYYSSCIDSTCKGNYTAVYMWR